MVATGYLAQARRFDVNPLQNMHLTIDDTVDNLGKTVLGLTLACARCHDHKFDPIPNRDYYALYGIFQSTRYPFPGSEKNHKPAGPGAAQAGGIRRGAEAVPRPSCTRSPASWARSEGEKRAYVEGVESRTAR